METDTTLAVSTTALSIGYEQGKEKREVARALDLALRAGELVCLLGPNGAGKSTLIRTLAGMQAPLQGQVAFAGTDFKKIPPRERAKRVSVVLTDTTSVGMMDARTLVSLGRHPYSGWFGSLDANDRARIDWALGAVGARPLAHRQVAELSDGERQKISIARALAQETRVMLLDEPTAFLDLPRRVELMTILRDLAHREKLALLLSTHDLDLALRFADRLWVMTHERSLIQGYPEAIAISGEFARVFASEKLDWDPAIGSFRAHSDPCLKIRIEGSGIEALWTQRAMERLGFGITETDDSVFEIKVSKDGWLVSRNGHSTALKSLASMIDWVRSQKW